MTIFLLILLVLLALILLVMGLNLLIGYYGYRFAMSRKSILKRRIEKHSKNKRSDECINYFSQFEKLSMSSDDNLNLSAFYKDNNSSNLAIVVHGYGGNHFDVYMQCIMFEKRGYSILALDLRAHGDSEGDMLTMGLYEHIDIIRWIEKMLEIKNYKIVLYGISMGASSVCMALGEKLPSNVICAIEDCGFDNANKEFSYVFSRNKFKLKWIYKIFYSYVKRVKKIDLKKVDVTSKLKESHLPVLFIHGGQDNFVPTEMVYTLYSAVDQRNAKLFIVDGAGHGDAFENNPSLYRQEVYDFLKKYLI